MMILRHLHSLPTKKRNHHHTANPRSHETGQIGGGEVLTENWVGVRVWVYTILHGSVHGQGEQAPLRPAIWGCEARAIVVIFFGDLLTLNVQRSSRAVRRVTKETGGGRTLAPMSQSQVLIL